MYIYIYIIAQMNGWSMICPFPNVHPSPSRRSSLAMSKWLRPKVTTPAGHEMLKCWRFNGILMGTNGILIGTYGFSGLFFIVQMYLTKYSSFWGLGILMRTHKGTQFLDVYFWGGVVFMLNTHQSR